MHWEMLSPFLMGRIIDETHSMNIAFVVGFSSHPGRCRFLAMGHSLTWSATPGWHLPGFPRHEGRMKTSDPTRQRARRIVRLLARLYPDARCSLNYQNPLQLLVATVLSAQCTDVRVNLVTPALFARYPDARAFAAADPRELEKAIQSTGFFRNKARNIIACCQALVSQHGGKMPATMEALVQLAGIGRKTANVILGNAFGIPGITVDTHVGRLSRRMGLTTKPTRRKSSAT